MPRRTPRIALILAPIALWAVVMAWNRVLLPLSAKLWRSETAVRAAALRSLGAIGER